MARSTGFALPVRASSRPGRRRLTLGLPFALTLPTLLVVFLVIGIPLVYSLVLSLYRINMLTKRWIFVGLQNYADVLPHPDFLAALARTAYFAGVTVIGGLLLGMAMALVLNAAFPGRNVLRSVMLIPWGMAPVTVGVLWGWIFDGSYGTLNALLFDLGLIEQPIAWLGDGGRAFNLVALVHVWNQAPLTALLILAALQSMPDNLHRAARIDGAGAVERFFKITFPWLRPMLLLIMLLTTINSIMAFDLFWTMTKGGPGTATTVFSWLGYAYAFQLSKFGEGAAILYILTVVCLLLGWVYLKLFTATERRISSAAPAADEVAAAALELHRGTSAAMRLIKLPPFRSRVLLSGATRRIAGRIGLALAAAFIFVWSFAPFLWLVIMSISTSADSCGRRRH
ncbi:MAG: sugar ABC transporter permease [Rhodospirillaceae bacterium]|nr:sugar ABC transporter permease [Rhodospirillaceae bacterium]